MAVFMDRRQEATAKIMGTILKKSLTAKSVENKIEITL